MTAVSGVKKGGGQAAYLGLPSSSFLAVPPRPRDVGLRGGIGMLLGRWGKARGWGMVVVERREGWRRGLGPALNKKLE